MSNYKKSKEIKVTGVIILVSFYKNGIVFHLVRSRYKRVYVSFDLLRRKGLCYDRSLRDLDLTISFAGKHLEAKGTFVSWYGGVCKTYVSATDFDLKNSLFRLPEELLSKSLSEVSNVIKTIFREVGLKSFDNSEIFNRIAVDPAFVFRFCETYDQETGKILVDFPTGLLIYKVLSGIKSKADDFVYLPTIAFKPASLWFYKEEYENGKFLARFKDLLLTFEDLMVPVNKNDLRCFVNLLKTDKSFILFTLNETSTESPSLDNLYYVTNEVYSKVKYVVTDLYRRATQRSLLSMDFVKNFFVSKGIDTEKSEDLESKQITAEQLFKLLRRKQVFALYGPPGVGKTTLLKNLLEVAGSHGILCQYVTLTAKQARRFPAGRTLADLIYKGNSKADVIFVDEASTLNLDTLCDLLRKCKKSCIVFVGDPEQAPPPVGPSVFDRLVLPLLKEQSLALKLTQVYRYDQKRLYKKIYRHWSEAYKWIQLLVSRARSKGYTYMVTTGIHDSLLGTKGLNLFLKMLHNQNGVNLKGVIEKYKSNDLCPEVGDLVVVVRNLTIDKVKIPRGTLGRVVSSNSKGVEVEIEFGNLLKKVFFLKFRDVALGYALEYYSSQGGEADVCIAVIPTTKILNENFIKKWNVITSRARICTILLMPEEVEKELSRLLRRQRDDFLDHSVMS